jgi:hypothetical protein
MATNTTTTATTMATPNTMTITNACHVTNACQVILGYLSTLKQITKKQDQIPVSVDLFHFLAQAEILQLLKNARNFKETVLNKIKELSLDPLIQVNKELNSSFEFIRSAWDVQIKKTALILATGLHRQDSPFSLLDSFIVKTIAQLCFMYPFYEQIASDYHYKDHPLLPPPVNNQLSAVLEIYNRSPIPRWAREWLTAYQSDKPFGRQVISVFYCMDCHVIYYRPSPGIFKCPRDMQHSVVKYLDTFSTEEIPPWIDIDTYTQPLNIESYHVDYPYFRNIEGFGGDDDLGGDDLGGDDLGEDEPF